MASTEVRIGATAALHCAGVAARLCLPIAGVIASVTMAATLSGCAALLSHESPLPQDGPMMTDIYRNHLRGKADDGADAEGSAPRARLPRRGADEDAVNAQRRALSEPLNNRFERLPNPDLVMHVFPHLSPGRNPVPGYDTTFPMYETVQYAMPGEVAPRYQPGNSAIYPVPAIARLPQPAERADLATADGQRKRHLLAMVEKLSPRAARVLAEYDERYTARCKTPLSADALMAVPSSGIVAYDQMFANASVADYPRGGIPGGELVRCDSPLSVSRKAAVATTALVESKGYN
jgi:conjugative transfer region lipoprotein (TIGR03751 family)